MMKCYYTSWQRAFNRVWLQILSSYRVFTEPIMAYATSVAGPYLDHMENPFHWKVRAWDRDGALQQVTQWRRRIFSFPALVSLHLLFFLSHSRPWQHLSSPKVHRSSSSIHCGDVEVVVGWDNTQDTEIRSELLQALSIYGLNLPLWWLDRWRWWLSYHRAVDQYTIHCRTRHE